jgi:hypothetical protein
MLSHPYGCLHIVVAKSFLDGPDVIAIFKGSLVFIFATYSGE